MLHQIVKYQFGYGNLQVLYILYKLIEVCNPNITNLELNIKEISKF